MRLTFFELLSFLSLPVFMVAIMFGFGQTVVSTPASQSVLSAQTTVSSESRPASPLIETINTIRSSNNLPTLAVSDQLTSVATLRANDMVQHTYYAHSSPSGGDFTQYIEDNKYACENLYLGDDRAFFPVNAWMNSDSHKQCLLSPKVRFIGYSEAAYTSVESQIAVIILSE